MKKVLDIWSKTSTFGADALKGCYAKLSGEEPPALTRTDSSKASERSSGKKKASTSSSAQSQCFLSLFLSLDTPCYAIPDRHHRLLLSRLGYCCLQHYLRREQKSVYARLHGHCTRVTKLGSVGSAVLSKTYTRSAPPLSSHPGRLGSAAEHPPDCACKWTLWQTSGSPRGHRNARSVGQLRRSPGACGIAAARYRQYSLCVSYPEYKRQNVCICNTMLRCSRSFLASTPLPIACIVLLPFACASPVTESAPSGRSTTPPYPPPEGLKLPSFPASWQPRDPGPSKATAQPAAATPPIAAPTTTASTTVPAFIPPNGQSDQLARLLALQQQATQPVSSQEPKPEVKYVMLYCVHSVASLMSGYLIRIYDVLRTVLPHLPSTSSHSYNSLQPRLLCRAPLKATHPTSAAATSLQPPHFLRTRTLLAFLRIMTGQITTSAALAIQMGIPAEAEGTGATSMKTKGDGRGGGMTATSRAITAGREDRIAGEVVVRLNGGSRTRIAPSIETTRMMWTDHIGADTEGEAEVQVDRRRGWVVSDR